MKKFLKVCTILAVILLLFGAALAVMASTVGGRERISEAVERVTGGRLHLDLGNRGIPFGIYWKEDWKYELDASNIYDEDYPLMEGDTTVAIPDKDVKKLQIEIGGYSFRTAPSADGAFSLTAEDVKRFQCYVSEGVLFLKAVNSDVPGLTFGKSEGGLTLYIPEGQYFEQVDIELGAGQIQADHLKAGEVNLEVGAGQITAGELAADRLEISVGAGQAKLPEMNVGAFRAEIGMGELVGSGSLREDADLVCSMGNLKLTLAGSRQDFNYELNVSAGNLDLGEQDFDGMAVKQTIRNDAPRDMRIDCSMGNVTIRFQE